MAYVYILTYLIVGLPVALAYAIIANRGPFWRRVVFGFILWSVWPLIPLVMVSEMLAVKRLQETCAWCGEHIARYRDPHKLDLWRKHLFVCQKHPLREENARLKTENARLAGTLSFIYTLASRATPTHSVGTFVEIMTRIEEVFDKPQGGLTMTTVRDANGVEYLRVDEVKEAKNERE